MTGRFYDPIRVYPNTTGAVMDENYENYENYEDNEEDQMLRVYPSF
jgi:hypothetical protein